MIKARAYKAKDYYNSQQQKTESPESKTPFYDLNMLAGLIEDFNQVKTAIKNFPLKSTLTLLGVAAAVFIAFKVGKKFGMIQTEFSKKLRGT